MLLFKLLLRIRAPGLVRGCYSQENAPRRTWRLGACSLASGAGFSRENPARGRPNGVAWMRSRDIAGFQPGAYASQGRDSIGGG
jgi:hypothetical protein